MTHTIEFFRAATWTRSHTIAKQKHDDKTNNRKLKKAT